MRISDWSSDVCSSDLSFADARCSRSFVEPKIRKYTMGQTTISITAGSVAHLVGPSLSGSLATASMSAIDPRTAARSEEHTSELQSLMRISYAVFCLKKQNNQSLTPSATLCVNKTL